MNNKKSIKKSITGITLAAIMIASIFAMVVPSVTAPGVLSEFGLGKGNYTRSRGEILCR